MLTTLTVVLILAAALEAHWHRLAPPVKDEMLNEWGRWEED